MPAFAIPSARPRRLGAKYSRTDHAIARKRKRGSASPTPEFDDTTDAAPRAEDEAPALSAAITNPLSLAPSEVNQYRVAGLYLDQDLPSAVHPKFPHRAIPPSLDETPILGEQGSENAGSLKRSSGGPLLRAKHVGVLTAILHRCLREGDIARASHAWALLLRSQLDGKAIDIRNSGYWGIGAELLIREGEYQPRSGIGLGTAERHKNAEHIEDHESNSNNDEQEEAGNGHATGETRWGSASGFRKAREYYERLILQYPYHKQFPNSVNELDFLPAMLSCWIYGIQYEQQDSLNKLSTQEKNDDIILSDAEYSDVETDDFYALQVRKEQRREEHLWKKRDGIRREALTAAEEVAARIDKVVDTPTYSDSHVLLRLRAMLALYIGDLAVPATLDMTLDSDNDTATEHHVRDHATQRQYDHEAGLHRRKEELARARKFFERARDRGGKVDRELRELSSEVESLGDGADGSY